MFAKTFIDKPLSFWDNILRTDETKVKLCGNSVHWFIYRWQSEAHDEKNTLPTVEHGGGSIVIWGCFTASGTRGSEYIEGFMKPEDYCYPVSEN